jgi:hypothetical protein
MADRPKDIRFAIGNPHLAANIRKDYLTGQVRARPSGPGRADAASRPPSPGCRRRKVPSPSCRPDSSRALACRAGLEVAALARRTSSGIAACPADRGHLPGDRAFQVGTLSTDSYNTNLRRRALLAGSFIRLDRFKEEASRSSSGSWTVPQPGAAAAVCRTSMGRRPRKRRRSARARHPGLGVAIHRVFAPVPQVVVDFDRPRRGSIRIDQTPLIEREAAIRETTVP